MIVVWLANQFEAQVDLSTSSGFRLTYSATDDLYVQLRPASHWSGGDKWLTHDPPTSKHPVERAARHGTDSYYPPDWACGWTHPTQ